MPTLSHGRVLYCIRAPGMTRKYVAKEPYGELDLVVGPLSRLSCCKLSQRFLRIASTLKPFLASQLSNVTNRVQNQDNCMHMAADYTPIAEAVNLSDQSCSPEVINEDLLPASKEWLPQQQLLSNQIRLDLSRSQHQRKLVHRRCKNACKTYLDARERWRTVHFLKFLVQPCAQKQRNKRCNVFLAIYLLLASIGKIHSKEPGSAAHVGHFSNARDLDQPPGKKWRLYRRSVRNFLFWGSCGCGTCSYSSS